jgi:hypothetical protein
MEGGQAMSLAYVVGTGRCGSTMLSQIMHVHSDVLNLNEFWNIFMRHDGDISSRDIPTHKMGGDEFWQLLSRCDPHTDGLAVVGITPYHGARFDPATGVPAICRVLASLADDPDALYDQLALEVPTWPRRPAAEQCQALFDVLATRLGRKVIVERTGGNLPHVPMLRQQFPEARFVFLHREGPDTALSMSRQPVFRLAALKILSVYGNQPSSKYPFFKGEPEGAEELKGLIEPPFDAARFMSYPVPLTLFGWLWSEITCAGVSAIRELPPDSWMPLRYETLLADPETELTRLAEFLGIAPERQWLRWAVRFIDRSRSGAAVGRLDPGDLAEVETFCAPGAEAYESLVSEHEALVN